MSTTLVVQYRTNPESAAENVRLVQQVYAALAELKPADFRYATYRLADGVTFVHVATVGAAGNPLPTLPAFAEFQREIGQRCVEPPAGSNASIVGSYASVE